MTALELLILVASGLSWVVRNVELARRLHVYVACDERVWTPRPVAQLGERPFRRHAGHTEKVLYERRLAY